MVSFTISYGQRRTNIVGMGSVEDYYSTYSIIGIDEVGVGSVAGPLVVCAVRLPEDHGIQGIKDSKKLSPAAIDSKAIAIYRKADIVIGEMSLSNEVDTLGIRQCHRLLLRKLINRIKVSEYTDYRPRLVVIDGSCGPDVASMPFVMIKQADNKSYNVAAASIVGKSVLDKMMVVASLEYPGYGFGNNKGYPTQAHKEAVTRLGVSDIHRLSYSNFYKVKHG